MKKHNSALKPEGLPNNTPLGSGQALPFPLSKGIISFCALLLLIITISGSSALLSSPIHPIGLLLGILIPAYLFLLFALIRRHSLFSTVLFFLQKQLLKLPSQATNTFSKRPQITFHADPKALQLLTKVIMHSAWMIIFIGLILGLFFQFTLKQYQFNLYSTLFPYESGAYLQIIQIFNYLPSFIFGELIHETVIISSLQGTSSALENATWAKWILLMMSIYGLLPRIILSLWAYQKYRHYQILCQQPPLKRPLDATIIDPASHHPVSERQKKTITSGVGEMYIALDIAYALPPEITIINDRVTFSELKEKLTHAPLTMLTLYIDSSLTPDRSLLRRIYTLLNRSMSGTIILIEAGTDSRLDEWHQKITPNLAEHEIILVKSLSQIQSH